MGRELKRVPLDFDWPLNKVWGGFLSPHHPRDCPDCKRGYTHAAEWLHSIVHLLMMAGRDSAQGNLHPWLAQLSTRPSNEPPSPDMAELTTGLAGRAPSFIHDSLDNYSAYEKIIKAAGLDPKKWGICQTCKGEGIHPEDVDLGKDWKPTEPPKGKGYQVWETVSEGSPISPVFKTTEELVAWLVQQGYSEKAARAFANAGWVPSAVMTGGRLYKDIEAAAATE